MQNNRESGFYNPRVFLAFLLFFSAGLLALVTLAAPTPSPSQSANTSTTFAPITRESIYNGVSPNLRDLPVAAPIFGAPIIINPVHAIHPPVQPPLLPVHDYVQQTAAPSVAMPAPLITFEAIPPAWGNAIKTRQFFC